jgi:type VII secretion-associated serine protease mycosin
MGPVVTRVSNSVSLRRGQRERSGRRAVVAVGIAVAAMAGPAVAAPAVAGPAGAAPAVAGPAVGAPHSTATAPGAAGYLAAPPGAIDDPVRDEQWQLDYLDATDAWQRADGTGVTVAILDSGVDSSHPDLTGQVLPGIDLVDGTTDGRSDPVGHGTTVAALIAGRDDDGRGVVGLAPNAKILPVRVLNTENRYDDATTVANGLRWAVDHGARVVNLSLGGSGASPALAEALDYAFDKDVVVVACTGNVSPPASTQVWYPAREPGVLAVAGLSHDNGEEPLWISSISGPQTVLAAPAADLLGARPGGYWRVQGTSFAAPLVSATAALVRSRWPQMSAANVVNRLVSTARDLGAAGRDDEYGFGAVDPVAALTATLPEVPRNPLDTNLPHGVAGFGPAPAPDSTQGADGNPAHAAPGDRSSATQSESGEVNSGSGAKRTTAAPAGERESPWRGLLGGLAACVVLVGIAATAANRLNRR